MFWYHRYGRCQYEGRPGKAFAYGQIPDSMVSVLRSRMIIRSALNFHVIVAYGVNISTIADNLVNNVKYKVEAFTGMEIEKINIYGRGRACNRLGLEEETCGE